jgi:putative SOS response-associated peptidase YedK
MLARMFGVDDVPSLAPRYNIAPSQDILAVRTARGGGSREIALLHWGFIPRWAKDPGLGGGMINARAETLSEKPSFRNAFRDRRCLVPADGFYEWRRLSGRKQPYYITLRDGGPFAIAGLWERREGEDGSVLESCALITTAANDLLMPVHDRMPAIVPPKAYDLWLDAGVREARSLAALLRPFPSGEMSAVAVGPRVNDPRHESPDCIVPLN